MSFKLPFKVKCVDNDGAEKHLNIGEIYDVTSTNEFEGEMFYRLKDQSEDDGWLSSRFEIVNELDSHLQSVIESIRQNEKPLIGVQNLVQEDVVQNGGSAAHQYRKSVNLPLSNNREEFVDADIEAMDVIDSFDLSFNLGNIVKACIRIGKKEGTDDEYDLNKIIFFALREQKKRSILTHKEFWYKLKAIELAN